MQYVESTGKHQATNQPLCTAIVVA